MDVGMDDGADVTPKKRRGRPKKLKTLAEVQACLLYTSDAADE